MLYSVEVDGERTGRGLPPRGEVRAAGGGLTARVGGSAALRRGERRDLELIIIIKVSTTVPGSQSSKILYRQRTNLSGLMVDDCVENRECSGFCLLRFSISTDA